MRNDITEIISGGWAVLPIPRGEKAPTIPWKNRTFLPDDFGDDANVGVKCGSPSSGRVDVDIDALDALRVAPSCLPPTECIHGRTSKPRSHMWYTCADAETRKFEGVDGSMIVEIRASGVQTVIPPSVHESGESVEWVCQSDPPEVTWEGLLRSVSLLASTAILSRAWPEGGSRHKAALALGGFLSARGLTPEQTASTVKNVAQLAGDEEFEDRSRAAYESATKHLSGERVTGGPTLAELVGQDVVSRLHSWFGGEDDDKIDKLNENHFCAMLGTKYVVGEEDGTKVTFLKQETFQQQYQHEFVKVGKRKVELGRAWMASPNKRRFNNVCYAPPPLSCGPEEFNTWRGFAVEAKEGNCAAWLQHARDNVCNGDGEIFDFVLDWMASCVQSPGNPGEVAIVLRGEQGTGKGVFANFFGRIFGHHFIQVSQLEHVTGKFNGHLSSKVVVFADEAFWGGNVQAEGSLRRLITERTLTIERKGFDPVSEPNTVHLLMATNSDWAIPAGRHERRFLVLDVNDRKRQDHKYFGKICEEMENGGSEALLFMLQKRKLPEKNRPVPKTSALQDQRDRSLSQFGSWWLNKLKTGVLIAESESWDEPVGTQLLYEDYVSSSHRRNGKETKVIFEHDLLRACGTDGKAGWRVMRDGVEISGNGRRVNKMTWHYTIPPLDELRRLHDEKSGQARDWPDVGEMEEQGGDSVPF